ncbi:stalk domain-containing protein [Paenibacillus hamazuiensis]|uniref:stalk domain-containing protein n=1 Tax=Paenibacillus hamazuiensis TaxID=2936508 RepID=UPI00200EF39B|nr:stalk domain-containing protein [Paenibacillus hamazuiensis]
MRIDVIFQKITAVFLAIALLLTLCPPPGFAASTGIKVMYNGTPLDFEDAQPVIRDGSTLVPFRSLFETLGFQVKWSDAGGVRKASGAKDGLEIELTLDSTEAVVNGQTVKLEVPAQMIEGKTMVPLRFISENSGYEVTFIENRSGFIINIEGTGGMAEPHTEKAEPGIVKGRVTDAQGNPIEGAEVVADNQLLYNSNAVGVTDADGYYRIPLGMRATTYAVSAQITRKYNGKSYTFDLVPDNDKPFTGDAGAIRNFTLNASGGPAPEGCYSCRGRVIFNMMDLYHPKDDSLPPPSREDVELTLTPDGPLVDGSQGQAIKSRGTDSPDGFGIHDVPLGRYKITALYAPKGEKPVQMKIRKVREQQYSDSVTTDFTSVTSSIHRIDVELKLP